MVTKLSQILAALIIFLISASFGFQITKMIETPSLQGSRSATPRFVGHVGNVTVPVGRDVALHCVVENIENYRVGWLKADTRTILTLHSEVITKNTRISLSRDFDPDTWSLHVSSVQKKDAGCYMCQVNTSPMRSQVGCIDVHVPPDIVSSNSSSDVSVTEGDTARLVCHARGHPTPQVTWRREDGHAIFRRGDFRNGIKVYRVKGAVLSLNRASRHHMAAYLCIAKNIVPPAISKRVFVSVNFGPEVSVRQQLLGTPLSADVELHCHVEAHPATVNYWLNTRGDMLLGGQTKYVISEQRVGYKVHMSLKIVSVEKSDIGVYQCVATNSLGTGEASVRLYHERRLSNYARSQGGAVYTPGRSVDQSAHGNSRSQSSVASHSQPIRCRSALHCLFITVVLCLVFTR